jgi:glycosyltransferase involved in cell wall biosynthesis
MRILVLHSRYRSGPVSGENRVVDDEVALLRQAGHQVTLVDPEPGRISGAGLLRTAGEAVWSRQAAAELKAVVRSHGADVVHCHNLFPSLSPAVLRAAGDIPVVMTLHNYRLLCMAGTLLRDGRVCQDCLGHSPLPGVAHGCYRGSKAGSAAMAASLGLHRTLGSFDRVDRFLAVSRFVADKHVEAGFPPGKLLVKPNFTWPAERRIGPGDGFVFLGRIAADKGLGPLLAGWPPGVKLTVAGDGPDAARLRAAAPPGVEFTGALGTDDVARLLTTARAVLVPSRWFEGAPRVVVEAFGAGVPVIASRLGALPELVTEGETGLLVTTGPGGRDPDGAWASAVERLLDDTESEKLGANAAARWDEHYSPHRALANLEAAYLTAGAVPAPPTPGPGPLDLAALEQR